MIRGNCILYAIFDCCDGGRRRPERVLGRRRSCAVILARFRDSFLSSVFFALSMLRGYLLQNLLASIIVRPMATKLTTEIRQLVRKELASSGGKARAKKYDHETLSTWAKRGGRPRKANSGRVNSISR